MKFVTSVPFLFSAAMCIGACGGNNNTPDASDVTGVDTQQPDVQLVDVQFDVPPPPSNSVCANATVLMPDMAVNNEDTTLGARDMTTCYTTGLGKVLFYRLTVPAGQTAILTVTPTAGIDPVIRWLTSCDPASCQRFDDRASTGQPEVGHWSNRGTTPMDVIIEVSSFQAHPTGTVNVMAHLEPSPTGVLCDSPHVVAAPVTLHGETLVTAESSDDLRCLPMAVGLELFYQVSVPAGQHLTVTATPMGMLDPAIRVFSACADTTCLGSNDMTGPGEVETLSYLNSGSAAANVIVSVAGANASLVGTFDVAFAAGP